MSKKDSIHLHMLLTAEEKEYRRLRRLAWRQTSYMRRNRTALLEKNAEEWDRYLPIANSVRENRIEYVESLRRSAPESNHDETTQFLLNHADKDVKEQIRFAVDMLLRTAEDLVRQNELNGTLAAYCQDLVAEENRILRHAVLEDSAGCYDGDAAPCVSSTNGVITEQA